MNPRFRPCARIAVPLILIAVLVGVVTGVGVVGAAEPLLTIDRTSHDPARHAVSGVESIAFDGDVLLVTRAGGEAHEYPLDSVTRIWFDLSGSATFVPGGPDAFEALAGALHLFQNRPNPVSISTSIRFDVPTPGPATLSIYDVTGARVRTLADGRLDAGAHEVTWDGRDDGGRPVAGGVYFYRLRAHGVDESRRLVYLR